MRGFAGLLLWHKLSEAGFVDVRFCEKGGDVGGTWYWNRYPGHRLRRRVVQLPPAARGDGLRPVDEVRVRVRDLRVLPGDGRAVRVLRALPVPHHGRADRVGRDDRPLDGVHRPRRRDAGALRDPRQRHPHHPEAGADPRDGDVRGRLVPHLAVELRRRSRTASASGSSAPARRPCRRSPSWPRSPASSSSSSGRRRPSTCATSGRRRTRSATRGRTSPAGREPGALASPRSPQGRAAIQANDDYLAGRVADYKERKQHERELTPEELVEKQLDSNFRIMEQIRARVDAIVEDPRTAEALKPYYPYGCKRPTFHDEYLPTFNLPHVHLVDTAPMGVAEINERGVVHDGVEYPLDVLIYATGFQWMATSTFNMVVGRERPIVERQVADRGHEDVPRPAHARLPQPVHRHRPAGRRRQLQLHRRHRHAQRLRHVDADHDARRGRRRRRCPRGGRGARGPRTAARPTSPPHRCATASRTTTVTAKRRRAASPTTAAPAGSGGAGTPRRRSTPYVFQRRPRSDQP